MASRGYLKTLILIAGVVVAYRADAYDFVPTNSEWNTWPGYCQAKYVWTPVGGASQFHGRVGARQRSELGIWESGGIYGAHHFCAGKIWVQRAKFEADKVRKAWMYHQAWNEVAFTSNRSDRSKPLYTQIVLLEAEILYEQKKFQQAIERMQKRIAEHPSGDLLYSATAIMQRRLGQLEQAKATLVQGNEATGGDSAEINYNLGLISIELGEIDDAKIYAENAYRLGYPLPGLRVKLNRLARKSQ